MLEREINRVNFYELKEYKKGYMCVCINESFCLTAEINTTHQLDLNKIKFA